MSRKTFTHSCGHAGDAFIPGSGYGERVAYMAEQGERQPCPACRAKAAQEKAAAAGLPALEGSDRQVAWAADIRPDVIERAEKFLATAMASLGSRAEEPAMRAVTKAGWWIDNRSLPAKFILQGKF